MLFRSINETKEGISSNSEKYEPSLKSRKKRLKHVCQVEFILKGLGEYIEKEGKETTTLKARPSKTRRKKNR